MIFPTIQTQCSDFLRMSNRIPMKKCLPRSKEGFAKVKVRHKRDTNFITALNENFKDRDPILGNRCVYAGGHWQTCDNNSEQYFIFPPNGFKFIYIENDSFSTRNFSDNFNLIYDFSDDLSRLILKNVLQESVGCGTLEEGLSSNSEVLIYNVSYYYAVKCSLVEDYKFMFYNISS